MTTFDEREKAFENKFKRDQELQFKVRARRNKLLGLWAAGKLGVGDAEAYARDVVGADFQKPGEDDVVEKIVGDAKTKGKALSEADVRREMERLMAEAKRQIMGEAK